MKTRLELRNLSKTFGDLDAVKNLNMKVLDGEFVAIVGPSGCGKTTTLNMLSGLEVPTSGDIILDGIVINDVPARKRDIGLIFQDYAIFQNLNVYDNLSFSLRAKRVPLTEIDRIVKDLVEKLDLEEILQKDTHLLTPGDSQRIAIGRTMIMNPSVFLLDEPLDNLDADLRVTMRGELKRLQKDLGTTMIYVTHDQEEATSLSDRMMVMDHGELQQFDTTEKIYTKPSNKFVAEFIGKLPMNFIEGYFQEEADRLVFRNKSRTLNLDISRHRKVIEANTSGKNLCLGIRPENILVASAKQDNAFEILVRNVEVLGMENVLHFHLKGEPEVLYKMFTPSEIVPNIDQTMWIYFDPEKVCLFDSKTNKCLI